MISHSVFIETKTKVNPKNDKLFQSVLTFVYWTCWLCINIGDLSTM